MKSCIRILVTWAAFTGAAAAYEPPDFPYAPAAGVTGSTAVPHADPAIRGWATAVSSIQYGAEVEDIWMVPEQALGPAGETDPGVVVLGRGGLIVLDFDPAIADGNGYDFAVFENAINDTFLELAYVEVSSDGIHFVRFPGYSMTPGPVGAFGSVQPEFVHGLAGKYRAGYGTPFDLSVLLQAHAAVTAGQHPFSAAYAQHLLDNFPHLDPANVRHVRLVDIPGDGSSQDCQGYAIFDPYPTILSAGFDLDAVAAMNLALPATVTFSDWAGRFPGVPPLPESDPDGDGWSSYLEYLMGSDPGDAASRPPLQGELSSNGEYSITLRRNLSAEGRLVIETSADAAAWSEPAGVPAVTLSTEQHDGMFFAVERLRLNPVAGTLLVRLRAQPDLME